MPPKSTRKRAAAAAEPSEEAGAPVKETPAKKVAKLAKLDLNDPGLARSVTPAEAKEVAEALAENIATAEQRVSAQKVTLLELRTMASHFAREEATKFEQDRAAASASAEVAAAELAAALQAQAAAEAKRKADDEAAAALAAERQAVAEAAQAALEAAQQAYNAAAAAASEAAAHRKAMDKEHAAVVAAASKEVARATAADEAAGRRLNEATTKARLAAEEAATAQAQLAAAQAAAAALLPSVHAVGQEHPERPAATPFQEHPHPHDEEYAPPTDAMPAAAPEVRMDEEPQDMAAEDGH